MKEKIKIVYFAYLSPNNWEPIVLEQLNSLKSLGLYDLADNIYISVSSGHNELKRLKQHIWAKFKKIEIINHFDQNHYEYPGLRAVWDLSQQDDSIILYFHTKGMTSGLKIAGQNDTRRVLFKHTISNYENYINEFKTHPEMEVGCVFPSEFGFAWYNFFWVRSSYVKNNLPEPKTIGNRYYWERWIGNEHSSKKDINCYSPFLGHRRLGNKAQLYQLRHRVMRA